jgi:hypothetical protein
VNPAAGSFFMSIINQEPVRVGVRPVFCVHPEFSDSLLEKTWDVQDPATKELMVTFYRSMLEKNLDKAEALREAKLEMIKTSKYSSPLSWSAFVLYGE